VVNTIDLENKAIPYRMFYDVLSTIATVEKNVITSNAALSKKNFKDLIVSLKSKKLLISEKTSLKLTPQGEKNNNLKNIYLLYNLSFTKTNN